MDIDCPDCGRRVTLDANNIVPYHDNAPPLRSVCSASRGDATAIVTMLATARAEAALAEREACVSALDAEIAALKALGYERDERGTSVVGWRIKSVRAARDAVRARTTPATLSTATLAAIAEARGLRVVKARAEVISFAEAMEAALAKNEHKGGWKDDGALELHQRIVEETDELRAELMKRRERPGYANNQALILSEAADVANFAMMVADVCGCLESRSKDGAK